MHAHGRGKYNTAVRGADLRLAQVGEFDALSPAMLRSVSNLNAPPIAADFARRRAITSQAAHPEERHAEHWLMCVL